MSIDEKVRGIEYTYLHFVWKALSQIWELDVAGDYLGGVEVATKLISYLPRGLQKQFSEKAEEIHSQLEVAKKRVVHSDIFVTQVSRNRYLQNVAKPLLKQFVRELAIALDKRNVYMEKQSLRLKGSDFKELEQDEG